MNARPLAELAVQRQLTASLRMRVAELEASQGGRIRDAYQAGRRSLRGLAWFAALVGVGAGIVAGVVLS